MLQPVTVLLLFLALGARAEPSCLARVAGQVASLRPAFPKLDGLNLVLETFESKEDYYRAVPRYAWRPPRERVYAVMLNPAACETPPPPEAEKAILAHELAHLEAYTEMGKGELIRLGWAYAARPSGSIVQAFEWAADDAAAARGYGPGLAAYRDWLYPRIAPKAAARKKALYRPLTGAGDGGKLPP